MRRPSNFRTGHRVQSPGHFLWATVLAFLPLASPLFGSGVFWSENKIDEGVSSAWSVYGADIDGDGDLDVLGAAAGLDEIAWWENVTGDGAVFERRSIGVEVDSPRAVTAADIDGDGDLDVLTAALDDDAILWWENASGDGTEWTEHVVDDAFNGAISVHAVDMDGDGDVDVLGAALLADEVAWWENRAGNGLVWSEHKIATSFNLARTVHAGDIDGDGDQDVVAGHDSVGNQVYWYENVGGNGSTWESHVVEGLVGVSDVQAVDMDGDLDLDVVGASVDDGIYFWENTVGDGSTWVDHEVGPDFFGAYSVRAADLDGDGDQDLLGGSLYIAEVAWWRNEGGTGDAWVERTVGEEFFSVRSVSAGDLDGDGEQDILGAASSSSEIRWWQGRAFDGPQLRANGTCPGEVKIRVEFATVDATMTLLSSPTEGSSSVPSGVECAGLPLGLESPAPLMTFATGGVGNYTFVRVLEADDCGLYFQAVDKVACETTNVTPLSTE